MYLRQAEIVTAHSLFVLLHFTGHHFTRSEVETSQINSVAQVTGQLRLAPELLSCGTKGEKHH